VKAGKAADPIEVPPVGLTAVVTDTLTDQVQLPRLYLVWHTPALYRPGDAELDVVASVLAGGKNSRLYKRLVYDLQVAQEDVFLRMDVDREGLQATYRALHNLIEEWGARVVNVTADQHDRLCGIDHDQMRAVRPDDQLILSLNHRLVCGMRLTGHPAEGHGHAAQGQHGADSPRLRQHGPSGQAFPCHEVTRAHEDPLAMPPLPHLR